VDNVEKTCFLIISPCKAATALQAASDSLPKVIHRAKKTMLALWMSGGYNGDKLRGSVDKFGERRAKKVECG
jgi:hypothetical protein